VIFLECNRSLSNARSFFLISLLVSLIGFAAVLLLVVLLSRRAIRPIQESYEKQKRFITDAGHELKTPLTVIDADISVLEMDVGKSEWIDDVRAQTKRLTKLTNDLVYLSKMDEENRSQSHIDFPLSDIAAEEAQSFRSRALMEKKSFESRIAPMINYNGDERAIRQLISILLDNALKYSDEGGSIRIALARRGKNISLSVYNTTREIQSDDLSHLFDRFYRTDRSRNSETGGYGLGLSIAQAVVSAHRGKISAKSSDGHSLTVTALLPC
jgi:two-component system sensor histidine kinase CiaH